MNSPKPKGNVRMVSAEMRRPPNDRAVFVNLLCVDEAGEQWHFAAASFCFDLKPGAPTDSHHPAEETPANTPGSEE